MKVSEIICTLVNAGVTGDALANTIAALVDAPAAHAPVQAPAPVPAPAPKPEPEPEPKPEPQQTAPQASPAQGAGRTAGQTTSETPAVTNEQLLLAVKELTSAVRGANIVNDQFGATAQQGTIDSAVAALSKMFDK